MNTITLTETLKSSTSWNTKRAGTLLLIGHSATEDNKDKVLDLLIAQDDIWKHYKGVVKLCASVSDTNFGRPELDELCEYVGKTDIYNVDKFLQDCADLGIDVFIYWLPVYD